MSKTKFSNTIANMFVLYIVFLFCFTITQPMGYAHEPSEGVSLDFTKHYEGLEALKTLSDFNDIRIEKLNNKVI